MTVSRERIPDSHAYRRPGYRPLGQWEGYTLLEVELLTGRTHQIRAHLSSIEHPLLGDREIRRQGSLTGSIQVTGREISASSCI